MQMTMSADSLMLREKVYTVTFVCCLYFYFFLFAGKWASSDIINNIFWQATWILTVRNI